MTKEEMITALKAVKNPVVEITTIYRVLDELGISYQKSKCGKCRKDLYNIAREELGLIKSAAEKSSFNDDQDYEWKYLRKDSVWYNGRIYNQNTKPQLIEKFVETHPTGYYERITKEQPQPETVVEEENINNEANFIENGN